ncbi:MAG TPA: DUF1524 domain-containing protein [Arthrobacter sp.]|nr:DUF1524 domain-containing protein [Arthrobacter sp.]
MGSTAGRNDDGARATGTRRRGVIDWIACGIAGLVLVSSTACAGPAPASADVAPAAIHTSEPITASASPTPTPSPSADPENPLDPDTAPAVTVAGASAPHGQPAFASKALDVLATLPIKGRAPKTGYSRDQFGQAWADVDRNGCDTRNDILRRDLTAQALKAGTHDCVVLSGTLNDPYTAKSIAFVRGSSTSSAVQIDHVVALSDAWQKGAQQLSTAQRLALANDPLNLLAVDGPTNTQKSDGDAATWLPPNKSYRCDYVARQISVKASYSLWVTQAEHDAMARVLADCPDAQAPTNEPAPAPAAAAAPAAPAPAAPVQPAPVQAAPQPAPPAVVPAAPAPAAVYYANCTAVRAAGAAPIRRGQPGYSSKLDRDGDGIACE